MRVDPSTFDNFAYQPVTGGLALSGGRTGTVRSISLAKGIKPPLPMTPLRWRVCTANWSCDIGFGSRRQMAGRTQRFAAAWYWR